MYELSPREERSKALFGTKDAIDIYGVISRFSIDPPQLFSVKDTHEQFLDPRTVTINSIRLHISKLEIIGALERVPGEERAFIYQRLEDPLWNLVAGVVSQEIDRSLEA